MAKNTVQSTALSHRDIITALRNQQYAPVYLLMGEEDYYIDRISEYMADNILTEDEKSFNLLTIYCTKETDVADIINQAKRYPMMSKYQIVIVKEAQNLLKIDQLQFYLQKPLQTTILVLCYKHGSIDRKKKLVTIISQIGVVYESKRLKDQQLPQFIDDYLHRKNVTIEPRARMMLVENIGSDLSRMAGELDKLCVTLPAGNQQITPELVEKNIGISKDFNQWELKNALVERNVLKANQIINYFTENPNLNPPVLTLAMLFNYFAGVMQAYYSPVKTEQGLMQQLELRYPWQLREYQVGMQNYSAMKTMQIIGKIRETDAKLKGVGKGNTPDADIMRELVYFILH